MLFDNSDLYRRDIEYVCNVSVPWEKLKNKTVLISGGTGLIGSFFCDVIRRKNDSGLGCKLVVLTRNKAYAEERIGTGFEIVEHDINSEISFLSSDIDYVIHMASNTHPIAYATDPVGTITANVIGCMNMLEAAYKKNATRVLFASSNEIYGENRGDTELFSEEYCGYIDCNSLRAGYPESKRCAEALCQAYRKKYNMDVVICRFTRTYGPTFLETDSKAMSQFLRKGMNSEDIVLKSDGSQFFSYSYVADAVAGMLTVLLQGEDGEAYNIADEKSDIRLRDLAKLIAEICGTKVVFELPDVVESVGYSKATKARLDSKKIKRLGWKSNFSIEDGVKRTIDITLENKI